MNATVAKRLPKNYKLVYEILRGAGHGVHFTMGEIYAHAKRKRPAIGFSTVYRGIARLRDLGWIDEIELPGSDSAVYELKGKPHAHFCCGRCGEVADVHYQLPARTIARLAARTGGRVGEAMVTLRGLCRRCSV